MGALPRVIKMSKQVSLYVESIDADFYKSCPKAVFAAIAVSPQLNGGFNNSQQIKSATEYLATEWDILHSTGIVCQPVPKRFRHFIKDQSPIEDVEKGPRVTNYYECSKCGMKWVDQHDAQCDKCFSCGTVMTPYKSIDLTDAD